MAEEMVARFDQKVALVTGAGSGIGRAVASRIAAEGGSVLAVDVDSARLDETRTLADGALETHVADLSTPAACAATVSACVEAFGGVDVLANVAGVMFSSHTTELTVDDYRRVMAINLDAGLFLSQAAIPHLLERDGNIVNVASNAGLQGLPYAVAYCMSKGGLIQMTRSLAIEFINRPLRVNAVAPAGTNTNLARGTSFPDDVDVNLLVRAGGHRGMAEPEDVAAVVAFLASAEARAVTGAVYAVDHGLTSF